MKNLILFMMIVNLNVVANSSLYSQEQVNLDLKNVSLKKCIKEIDKQTMFGFLYNGRELNKVTIEKAKFTDARVEEVLDVLLKENGYIYEIYNDVLLVKKDKRFRKKTVTLMQLDTLNVTGFVYGENGEPLPGVSIYFEATPEIGTATDINGKYRITKVLEKQKTLAYSFLGFERQVIEIDSRNTINVTLKEASLGLSEVIVTGYQTLSRERTTGSFSVIDNKKFEERITTNFTEGLDGLAPGLYVDGDNKITIRGAGTLYGNTDPLFVVDGFPVEADLSTINPDDIKSITVLKDAAASSIWGVKAANGVIVITTKMGNKRGETEIKASYYLTVEEAPSFSDANLMNSAELIDFELETYDAGAWNPLRVTYYPQYGLNPLQRACADLYFGNISQTEYDNKIAELKTVDAYKQMEELFFQKAISHQANISLSGGTDKSIYYSSLSYNGNEETFVGNSSDRINVNLKNAYSISDKLTLLTAANFTYSNSENNGISLYDLGFEKPYKAIVDENGNPIQYYMIEDEKGKELEDLGYLSYTKSIVDVLKYNDNTTKGFDARLQVGLNYKILSGLDFDTKFQYERGYSKLWNYKSIEHPDTRRRINTYTLEDGSGGLEYQVPLGGWLNTANNDHEAWTWRNQLSYNRSLGEKHQISAIAGAEIRKYVTYSFTDEKFGFDSKTLNYARMDEGAWLSTMQNNTWYGRSGMGYYPFSSYSEIDNRDVSFFLNGSYTYNSKYTLTASGRIDQSNLFGSDKEYRYKPLWSVGSSWKVSEENFLKGIDWLNNMIIRATYGVTGNTNKNFYPELMGTVGYSYSTGNPSMTLTNPANDKLRWESAYIFNIGLDWSVLSNRIWGSFEYYNKDSKDIIGRQTMDPTYGWSAANVNFASMNNKGIEMALNLIPVKTKDFVWETNLNVTYNENKVVEVGISGATLYNYLEYVSSLDDLELYSYYGMEGELGIPIKGKPLTRVYAYKWGGLDNTGQPQIYDENNELISWSSYSGDPDALVYMGSATPKYFGSFRNSISFKGFTFITNFTYKFGYVFRAPRSTTSQYFGALKDDVAERWREPGDELQTDVPVYDGNLYYFMNEYYSYADINVLDGDLIRLKDISIDYNLPEKIISKTPFKTLNIKFQARNLWLWTANDEGIDPDRLPGTFYEFDFPTPKSFVIGIKATF